MDPITQAIWFIEFHSSEPLDLEAIAASCGLSRFHLTRAFSEVTGHPVMRYLKGRRLTEAARSLAKGAPDILTVALESGYGSHESFTRAFRDQFDTTPESVRSAASAEGLNLVEAFRRDRTIRTAIDAPRIESVESLLIAGFDARITYENMASIPQLWQKLGPHIGHVKNEIPGHAYGVKLRVDDDAFEYMAGVRVSSFDGIPSEFRKERIPERTYAVFVHHGHISTIRETMNAIWCDYLPSSDGRSFNPSTGTGDVEIFIPIQR